MPTSNPLQRTLDQEVDAFWAERPPRLAALTARIRCAVCDRKEDVPILSSGLLCSLCRADLAATERYIRETLELAEQALDGAASRWDADFAHATEDDQMRYGKVCAAQDTPKYQERYQRALDKSDGLSVLLRSAAGYETAIRMMDEKQRWADTALAEAEAARDAD